MEDGLYLNEKNTWDADAENKAYVDRKGDFYLAA